MRGAGATNSLPRVLAVDEDPALLRTVSRVLRGFDVTVAATANDAVAWLEGGRRFDAVLLDPTMCLAGGGYLHLHLAELVPEQARRIGFVMASSGGGAVGPRRPYLAKPFGAVELRQFVASLAVGGPSPAQPG